MAIIRQIVLDMNQLEKDLTDRQAIRYDDSSLDSQLADLLARYQRLSESDDSELIQARLDVFYGNFQTHFETVATQKRLAERKAKRAKIST